jgi:hypothetical protein
MTWEIVAGLITLALAAASIGSPLWRLSKAITKLDVTLAGLDKTVNEDRQLNRKEHTEMREQLQEHETRISHLEWQGGTK